jgi:FkbM family methyltransferase
VRHLGLRGHERPFAIRIGTTDYRVLHEIFFDGEYDDLVRRAPGGIRTIVDLGSNVGFSVRLWQHRFPTATIVAVEPDTDNLALCRVNALAGLRAGEADPIFIQACAAGQAGRVDLDRSLGSWGYFMTSTDALGEGAGVAALTVGQIVARAGLDLPIDLLKCDVEGAEEEIFGVGGAWLETVRAMVVEVHGDYTPDRFLTDLARSGHQAEATVRREPSSPVNPFDPGALVTVIP